MKRGGNPVAVPNEFTQTSGYNHSRGAKGLYRRFQIFLVLAIILLAVAIITISTSSARITIAQTEGFHALYLPALSLPSCSVPMAFDLEPAVPTRDVNEIKTGMCRVQPSLENFYGGDMPLEIQRNATVKVVARGETPCCTALDESGFRPYFDILSPEWVNAPPSPYTLTTHHQVVAAHEYVHGWVWSLSCMSNDRWLSDWLNEGIAHYVGHDHFIRGGHLTVDEVRAFQVNSSIYTGEADVPLESLEGPGVSLWPGHIGYIAVEKLVTDSKSGLLAPRLFCQAIEAGNSVERAFQDAFGVSRSDFYHEFPAYFDTLRKSASAGSTVIASE